MTTTMPDRKASNGRAERLIGRLKRQVRALLSHHQLPPSYWPHALRHAAEELLEAFLKKLERALVVSMVEGEKSASRSQVPPTGVEQLVRAVVLQCCPEVLHGQVLVTCCDACELHGLWRSMWSKRCMFCRCRHVIGPVSCGLLCARAVSCKGQWQ